LEKKQNIKESIQKTGFILEYNVNKILANESWKVINNKYYLDDLSGIPREIDLLAYKAVKSNNIRYYTCLLISCKKSEQNDWVFITKENSLINSQEDELTDKYWSNDPLLKLLLSQDNIISDINSSINGSETLKQLFVPERDLFAFQEISKTNQKVQNDKAIFSSLNSLVKAVTYELLRLPDRRKESSIYNFHLLSICDTDFFESYLSEDTIEINDINSILYRNQFIVNKKENHFTVDFIKFEYFENRIKEYNELDNWYKKFYTQLIDDFYSDITTNLQKRIIHFKCYKVSLDNVIKRHIQSDELEYFEIFGLNLNSDDNGILKLRSIIFSPENIERLNSNEQLNSQIKNWLKKWYRYEGDYLFEHEPDLDNEYYPEDDDDID